MVPTAAPPGSWCVCVCGRTVTLTVEARRLGDAHHILHLVRTAAVAKPLLLYSWGEEFTCVKTRRMLGQVIAMGCPQIQPGKYVFEEIFELNCFRMA